MKSSVLLRAAGVAVLVGGISPTAPALGDYFETGYDEAGYRNWDLALGATAGTLGLGVEVSTKLTDLLVLRATGTGLSFDYDGEYSGTSYAWDADVRSLGITADLHPFGNEFRISGGFRYISLDFDGTARHAASYEIGPNTYVSTDTGALRTNRTIDTIAPYLGFGFDTTHFGSGLSFGVDIGALYIGDQETRVTTERDLPGLAEDLAREAREGGADEWYEKLYPVVMFSLKYRF